MTAELFGYLTSIFLLIGFVPYLQDMIKGKTKPERASWLIWNVLGCIAVASQYANGATWSLVLPAFDTALGLIIFAFSIPYGTGGLTKRDIFCLILAGIGLFSWYLTNQPILSLLIIIGIDASAMYLTIMKTYEQPESETAFSWIMASLGGVTAALAVGSWSILLLIYPIYIVLANASVPLSAVLGRISRR